MPATSPTKSFKENIQGLVKLARTDRPHTDKLLDALERHLPAFPRYVNAIWDSEHMTQIAYIRYADDIEMLHDRVQTYDTKRKNAHNSMVTACNILNRMCDMFGTPRFCPDLEDNAGGDERIHRKLCADFCGDVVIEVYEGRDGTQLSAERLAKIEQRANLMATPKHDHAEKMVRASKHLDENEMKFFAKDSNDGPTL